MQTIYIRNRRPRRPWRVCTDTSALVGLCLRWLFTSLQALPVPLLAVINIITIIELDRCPRATAWTSPLSRKFIYFYFILPFPFFHHAGVGSLASGGKDCRLLEKQFSVGKFRWNDSVSRVDVKREHSPKNSSVKVRQTEDCRGNSIGSNRRSQLSSGVSKCWCCYACTGWRISFLSRNVHFYLQIVWQMQQKYHKLPLYVRHAIEWSSDFVMCTQDIWLRSAPGLVVVETDCSGIKQQHRIRPIDTLSSLQLNAIVSRPWWIRSKA